MARFDVFTHPDADLRKVTPFLVDVQNSFIDGLATHVVLPMRLASTFGPSVRDLNPPFEIQGKKVVLDTASIAAFPFAALSKPVASLASRSEDVIGALDTLFGSY